jgi:hypothetical protein
MASFTLTLYLATSPLSLGQLHLASRSLGFLLALRVFSTAMGVLLFCAFGGLVAWLVTKLMRIGRRDPCLPNGPPTVPLLGNLNIFPKADAHMKYVCYTV